MMRHESTTSSVVTVAGGLLISLYLSVSAQSQSITTESLLRELANRDALARFPSPAYRAFQCSSYDRASVKPATDAWTSNRDYSQFLRTMQHQGRTEHVMMEADGPGAIVRIWITWAGRSGKPFSDGKIRLYLDGAADPDVIARASEFIDGGPDGSASPFGGAPFAYGVSPMTPHDRRGHNLFAPIPYAKSCRITYETDQAMGANNRIDESFYYHVGYRTYEPGTPVETFAREIWESLSTIREQVASELSERLIRVPNPRPSASSDGKSLHAIGRSRWATGALIESGGERTLQLDGPAAIESIQIAAGKLSPQQRRSTVLQMTFDGQKTVEVPLEGFFTAGYSPQPFQTWMTGYESGNYRCSWTMPFQQKASFAIKNGSNEPVTIDEVAIVTKPWQWDDSSMYFHADWRSDQGLSTGVAKTQDERDGVVDLGFLSATGQGVLVGDSITLFSGAARWWGEGDEKIYLDGEPFPSHFGTGTEDYYGYAWCRPERFSMPFHAQPVGRGALLGGLVVNTRIRSLDAIPFRTSIDFDMELWHWSSAKVNYARTVFWYGRPGARSLGSTPELTNASIALKDTDLTEPTSIEGAIEGESARIVKVSGGNVEVDRYSLFGWSGGAQLLWKDAKPGDQLVLEFDSLPATGGQLQYTIGPDYGQVEVAFRGSTLRLQGRFIGIISVLETRRAKLPRGDTSKNRITLTMKGGGEFPRRFGLDAIVPE